MIDFFLFAITVIYSLMIINWMLKAVVHHVQLPVLIFLDKEV